MAPTNYYVDPDAGDNADDGSISTPWATPQYALDNITQDTNEGDQINIKEGVDAVLTAALDLSTYGTPGPNAPLIIRGYTSAANDGGTGGIDGNATYTIIAANTNYVHFIDMHLHNSGSATVVDLGVSSSVQDCEIDNSTGNGVEVNNRSQVSGCNIHNIGGVGINCTAGSTSVFGNYLKNGTNDFSSAISCGEGTAICRNIISIDGSSNGIYLPDINALVLHNSILCAGGSGNGIVGSTGNAWFGVAVFNNLVEGFSGAGGASFSFNSNDRARFTLLGNASRNSTTHYENQGDDVHTDDNETLSASPFAKSGSDTFANRGTYFAPVDTGNVFAGAYPTALQLDKGAVQSASSGGGPGIIYRMSGSIIRGI